MFVLGISGGIGCGKSAAAAYFRDKDIEVVDADQLSFAVTQKGGKALNEVIALFGESILDEEGAMDRAEVARIVFNDKKKLDQLSAIVHRHVLAELGEAVKRARRSKAKLIVLDVPIPVKEGFLDQCDYVLVIWTDDELRLRRLAARGMQETEALRRIAMQMTREEYAALASEVITNNGTLDELYESLDEFSERELVSRGIRI